jgi:uncharacterized repeat protein (TIGR03803 family)
MANRVIHRRLVAAVMGGILVMVAAAMAAPAQTFTTLVKFTGANGNGPTSAPVQGTDGNLYGTTYYGGSSTACASGCGTVFKLTPSGTLTTIHSFDLTDGENPNGLVLGSDGNFYGTTYLGGTASSCSITGMACGTVFKITPQGALTTLYNFAGVDYNDGSFPAASLIQGLDGNFYGTTYGGGTSRACDVGCGTVFGITPGGSVTVLLSFDLTDGFSPFALVQGTDGNFYGTTEGGGSGIACYLGCGTVFKVSPAGTLTTLHSFTGPTTDGSNPYAGLVQGRDGNFYGTTSAGGDVLYDCTYESVHYGCGTVFEVTGAGTLTIRHNFGIGTDGIYPVASLTQSSDGNLYGTTEFGGTATRCNPGFFQTGCGTIFEISPQGKEFVLHIFHGTDGAGPEAGLFQATNGVFYGTTAIGGAVESYGSVFSLDTGLAPFATTVPTAGAVGKPVAILGNNLSGATGVTFNGTPATFTVVSDTEITTTVPSGATTGSVRVVTPGGTLTSNVDFRVHS